MRSRSLSSGLSSLWKNSKRLHQGLRDLGYNIATETAQSAIIAVMLPDQETAVGLYADGDVRVGGALPEEDRSEPIKDGQRGWLGHVYLRGKCVANTGHLVI